MATSKPTITLEYYDWAAVQEAINHQLRYIEENNLTATGMGSQGLATHVERLERAKSVIRSEASKQEREQWLKDNPEIAKEVEGLTCELEFCGGPISATGCTRVGCPIRAEIDAKAVWMVEGIPIEPGQEIPTYGPFKTKIEADRFAHGPYERYVYNAVTHPRGGRS